jgi:hypothetical protein
MELETLKTLWQEQETPPLAESSGEQLLALLQRRSGGPIARMRRNLRLEVVLMIVAYIPCIVFYWLAFNGKMAGVSWLFVGALLFFYVYYYRKNQLLKKMQCVSCEVRSNLAGQLKTLRRYIRFYFWASTLIVPVMVFIAFEIALRGRDPDQPPFNWGRGLPLLLALIAVTTTIIYYFNRWYINKLYGRHIRKLQDLLREMDEI